MLALSFGTSSGACPNWRFIPVPASAEHNGLSKKAIQIKELVQTDGSTSRYFQDKHDFIVRSLVRDIRCLERNLARVEKKIQELIRNRMDGSKGHSMVSNVELNQDQTGTNTYTVVGRLK